MRSWGSPTSFARPDLPRRRELAGLLEDQAAEVREGRAVGVRRWVPHSRTLQRLRTMQEYLADRNFNADSRRSAIEFSGGEKARVVDDPRPAVHAQGFLGTGDEEGPCCMETLRDPFERWRGFDHATRTNLALPSLVIRLSDLTAIATSVARRASRRDFNVSPMTRL